MPVTLILEVKQIVRVQLDLPLEYNTEYVSLPLEGAVSQANIENFLQMDYSNYFKTEGGQFSVKPYKVVADQEDLTETTEAKLMYMPYHIYQ